MMRSYESLPLQIELVLDNVVLTQCDQKKIAKCLIKVAQK